MQLHAWIHRDADTPMPNMRSAVPSLSMLLMGQQELGRDMNFFTATLTELGNKKEDTECCGFHPRAVVLNQRVVLSRVCRYNRNEFAADMAKLGVRPDMRLTRREWSMIRRRIPNRPRLFSKRFIFSQLQKRNQYRETFRELQANPELPKKFDYEVTATIPVGATVTAFNKRVRVLHRGVVLFHDAKGQGYLVLFERKHLGYEFCPDTEVASHGVPKVLIKSPAAALDGSSLEPTIDHNSHPGNLPYGTLLQQPSSKSKPMIACG
jgi:hypothetical protein